MREQGTALTQSWTDWQREKVALRQQQKPLCAAGAPPPPPPKDEPEDYESSSGENMPDDCQVPHHPKGDNKYARYTCFIGGRLQGKIKCQRCARKSDMFSQFIFVTGSVLQTEGIGLDQRQGP
eukprot:3485096-Amphidinium_carterae.1